MQTKHFPLSARMTVPDPDVHLKARKALAMIRESTKRIYLLMLMVTTGVCLGASVARAAEEYYTEERIYGSRPEVDRERPFGHIGPTGMEARIHKGVAVTVEGTQENTPAHGRFQKGDVILGVNGASLKGKNPYVFLGEAITAAEAGDGRLAFEIRRGDATLSVTLSIPVLGSYGDNWPLNCPKSKKIIDAAVKYYSGRIAAGGDNGMTDALACLFLMSTGDDSLLPLVKSHYRGFIANPEGIGDHTWNNGYNGIACAEYYLRTGDRDMLPVLQYFADNAKERQFFGCGWGHWGRDMNPGYVAGGLMNPASAQVLTTLILAKECGVDVDEQTLLGALRFFWRFAGRGTVPYGDHRGEGGLGSNGKDGMIAAAMQAACGASGDTKIYEMARDHLSMSTLTSYNGLSTGHGDDGRGDGIWRGIAAAYLMEKRPAAYRDMMNRITWWVDLSRFANGGLGMATCMGYNDVASGAGVAMLYTAPLKKLRITGAPRSRFAKDFKLPGRLWGNDADLAFLDIDNNPAYGQYGQDEPSHVPFNLLGSAYTKGTIDTATVPRSQIMKNVYHRRYMIRAQAAKGLRRTGELGTLTGMLDDRDPRVRRAALDGITDWNYWFTMGRDPLKTEAYTPELITGIVKRLRDPDEAWYVVDGALFAMHNMPAGVIEENIDAIMPWTKHSDWWLRQSSFVALQGIEKDPERYVKVLPTLLDMMVNEVHTQPRETMVRHIDNTLKRVGRESEAGRMVGAGFVRAVRDSQILPGPRSAEGAYNVLEAVKRSIDSDPASAVTVADLLSDRLSLIDTRKLIALVASPASNRENPGKGFYTLLEKLDEAKRMELTDILFDVYRAELVKRLKAEDKGKMPLINTIVDLTNLKEKVAVPSPDPATFASPPKTGSIPEIVMTATEGRGDFEPIEYFFDETSGNPGGTDSAWTTNPVYVDTGLAPGTRYTYTVTMRNALLQAGHASGPFSVTTPTVESVSVPIPNGDFDTVYKPGQTTITATISGWSMGVGPACQAYGTYNFSDKTSGTVADIPGWIGYDRDGWIRYGGAGTQYTPNENLQGVLQPGGRTSGNSFNVNGASWGNRAGGLIVSAAPIGKIQGNATYVLVAYARGMATPFVLRLLADGEAVTPTSAIDPQPNNGWQKFSRTYAPGDLARHVGKEITIVCGLDRDAKGTQIAIDDLLLKYYVIESLR